MSINDPTAPGTPLKRAVLYLRVSTKDQVTTDYDPEGLSIPAQRAICERHAENLGIEIVGEYVEPGSSALSMDKRPEFQSMLTRLQTERDAEVVLVYKLSRLNRNRIDDAYVLMQLRAIDVELMSATEKIDATPEGQLMHGVLASFNEFRSRADGADIRLKMRQKAINGGTIGKAPLGYLNYKEELADRSVSSVKIDPERGPLVQRAFELYSTGEYSLERLQIATTDLGLRKRPTRRWPNTTEVSVHQWSRILRDPYYTGIIEYGGEYYTGRHEALIDEALFQRVQSVLEARHQKGGRERVHFHYLKNLLYCDRCHEAGRTSRLIYTQATGKGGVYEYYVCMGRKNGLCDLPYLHLARVEQAVIDHYRRLDLPRGFSDRVLDLLHASLDEEQATATAVRDGITAQLKELDQQEERLVDLAADGELPKGKISARLKKLSAERRRLEAQLIDTSKELAIGAEVMRWAIELLADISAAYARVPDNVRGTLNRTFFEKVYLNEHGEAASSDLQAPFQNIVAS